MSKVPVSVVIITKNEERNMHDCLKSVVDWADEIVIVDDESCDRTVEISKGYGAKIFHRKMDNEGIHRNWAYAQAKNEWVLSLDADEMVSSDLAKEIVETIPNTNFNAFDMPMKNYIGKYWVQYSGWYPAGKLRMFQKSRFKYEEVGVHPRVFLDGKTGHLTKDLIHKGYPDFEHFLQSLNRQTTLEAEKWIQTGRKMPWYIAAWRTIDRFFRSFVMKQGYRDGFVGFMIAYYASLYQVMSYAKYWERTRGIKE